MTKQTQIDKEPTLEERLREHFPKAKKSNIPEFDCLVIPMSKMDLVTGKVFTLLKTIKEYEEEKGYTLVRLNKSDDSYMLTYEKDTSRHSITVDGMFPDQVNIYYLERRLK